MGEKSYNAMQKIFLKAILGGKTTSFFNKSSKNVMIMCIFAP